jgi:hypothetical protein
MKIRRTPIILNKRERIDMPLDQPIDVAMVLAMADLKAQYIDVESGRVRYRDIRGSEAFERYKALTGYLKSFPLQSLQGRDERLAFWINLYNTTVIHGVIELGLEQSVKEFPGFFDRVMYEIGGYFFSLTAMEHGILRGNRRPPYRLFRPFQKGDPRSAFMVAPMDPRVHFALVCGARSCPPISFYDAGQIDFQLQLASASFINSPQVKIYPEKRLVLISMIFKWYQSDFGGGEQSLVDILLTYLDEGEKKDFLKENKDRVHIRYQDYDWSLNQS